MNNRQHIIAFFAGAAVFIITIAAITPMKMAAHFRSVDDDGTHKVQGIDLAEHALKLKDKIHRNERRFWDAFDVYRQLHLRGIEDLPPIDINDRDSIEVYLQPLSIDEFEEAFMMARSPFTILDELPEPIRDRMEGYIATRSCPVSIRRTSGPEFYELCTALLEVIEDNDRELREQRWFPRWQRTAEHQSIEKWLKIIRESSPY